MLFTHYMEHQKQLGDLGIVQFLSMHYWGEDLDDDDQDQDMRLPFKKLSNFSSFQIAEPAVKISMAKQTCFQLKISRLQLQDPNLSDPALDGLFRPPRV